MIQYILAGMVVTFFIFLAVVIRLKRKGVREIEAVAFKKYPNMKYVMQKVDIENFKAINEMFDYDTGNRVLRKISKALSKMDNETFLCARSGNDEFFMFSAFGYLDDDSTRGEFEAHFKSQLVELASYEFGFRYGRYFIQKRERDVTDMINKTTLAHSMAKNLGHKNTWDYDEAYRQEVRRSTELINLSKGALEHKEFIVYLQPKFNLKEKKVTSSEALVRWINDEGKVLLPDEFIPVFEQNCFVTEIDFYVLKAVCARVKLWIEKGHKILPVSVNFSRVHLKNPNFVRDISDICDRYGDIRRYIEIELTETAVTENADKLAQLLDDLHEAGFTIAIDDFGAGYSSLGMLKDFKVDVLKLDQSFFEGTTQDTRGNIVVNGIAAVAHELGMKIVAEGIELSEQYEPLESNQLELAQGFFFAHPMPMEEFEQKYLD